MRTILFLAQKGFGQHAFSSLVASLTIALAAGLFLSTFKIKEEANKAFSNASGGFDAVLGARGSKLQLILNALFHLEASPGNLSWEQYETILKTPGVREAFPIAVGDNYLGYRLVGTLPNLFTDHQWRPGENYTVQKGGRIFTDSAKEALVGSMVARKLNLKIGDRFHPYHGLTYKEESKHSDIYVVVGLLEATGTPADRVIWIPIKGIQLMEGHDASMAQSVSAVLLTLKGAAGFSLDLKYNKQGDRATLAWPVASILGSFFNKLNWFEDVLSLVAYMVALIGSMIIFATLRSAMNERIREFAILRCLGASRRDVTFVVLAQSIMISFLGALGSLLFSFVIHSITARLIREQTGVVMEGIAIDQATITTFFALLLIGLLSGLLPALQAYRVNLSENLKPRT
ncbi:MAG: ABC transporter permease [Verrucomicrobiota bacterium]|nr:ABC transporter permease [Verrucomicrobiota bacterium]MEC8656230.1 ABC transporter permease [Verrucomicrobiota bacterium]MEC8866980.1 ABC transporter permease [Verrucomicrobiota bacterium]